MSTSIQPPEAPLPQITVLVVPEPRWRAELRGLVRHDARRRAVVAIRVDGGRPERIASYATIEGAEAAADRLHDLVRLDLEGALARLLPRRRLG